MWYEQKLDFNSSGTSVIKGWILSHNNNIEKKSVP